MAAATSTCLCSEVDDDILYNIMNLLDDIVDMVHFGATCRLRRRTMKESTGNPQHRNKAVLLFCRRCDDRLVRIHSFSHGKTYELPLPHHLFTERDNRMCAMPHRLLALQSKKSKHIHLINPLTGSFSSFPPLAMKPSKSIATSSPLGSKDFTVAAVCNKRRSIAMITSATGCSSDWTYVDFNRDRVHAIAFHRGCLYAITDLGATFAVKCPDYRLLELQDPLAGKDHETAMYYDMVSRSLVESPDGKELFLAVKREQSDQLAQVDLKIFKYNSGSGKWDVVGHHDCKRRTFLQFARRAMECLHKSHNFHSLPTKPTRYISAYHTLQVFDDALSGCPRRVIKIVYPHKCMYHCQVIWFTPSLWSSPIH